MWDARNLIAQARAARRAGADIVIVKYHGGSEYVAMPNPQQVALARALTASPYVDLVVGEHAHVVQPITKVNGKWVVYGMGNAIAQNETVAAAHLRGHHRKFYVPRDRTWCGAGLRGRPCGVRADVLEPLLLVRTPDPHPAGRTGARTRDRQECGEPGAAA